ncbi:hypothetical protein IMSHALPRED_009833 [Imshaugia aleurites]|uniref:Uncharacterized protein n=1 Tax=Imshaugia aleurites TaxID=172621 RepID=A0A8H3G543_9LECA|nr:hypothetical protein IMSHALPRED_009833 [Imshaugia aleurites]
MAIGSPTLIETTADENTLQGTTNINNGSFSISSRPAFGRKRTEDVLKGLPALPLYIPSPNPRPQPPSPTETSEADTESDKLQVSGVADGRPLSEAPTASSMYSQPSPELSNDSTLKNGRQIRSSSLYPDDISPPGSPYMNGRSRRSSPDVSPVSDSTSPLAKRSPVFTSGRFNSNIPVAKKTRKFWNRPSTTSSEQGSSLTHWDVYSGEPTTRERGKPPQTTPSAVKLNAEPSPGRLNGNFESFGTSTHISGGNTIGRKRVASRDLNNTPIVRPEWRGAGGRHKIVNPLLDKPLPPGKSPTFPAGSEKHRQDQRDQDRSAESTPSPSPQQLMTRPTRPSVILDDKELEQRVTLPGSQDESSPSSTIPPAFQRNTQSPSPAMSIDDARSPLGRNPSNEEIEDRRLQMLRDVPQTAVGGSHLQKKHEVRSEAICDPVLNYGDAERDPSQIESRFRADLQHMHLQDQLPSRFSSTTYATTTYESPPSTPEVGSNSSAISTISTTPNSILNRKRPVPPAGVSNSKVTARKPTPSELGTTKNAPDNKRKSLPRSPPEVEATSRIASLQAKLDDLRQRRKNIQTVIHELTNVVQPSSIAYDMASRQEIKRTVDGLSKELAQIVKDEHETGLKLHRALKRDDEFAAYEPTSIWIRRVTS